MPLRTNPDATTSMVVDWLKVSCGASGVQLQGISPHLTPGGVRAAPGHLENGRWPSSASTMPSTTTLICTPLSSLESSGSGSESGLSDFADFGLMRSMSLHSCTCTASVARLSTAGSFLSFSLSSPSSRMNERRRLPLFASTICCLFMITMGMMVAMTLMTTLTTATAKFAGLSWSPSRRSSSPRLSAGQEQRLHQPTSATKPSQ
mmetsp:Transcript_96516/g.249552  ORF Transcript_96516/g.249552 Transcript_96516/m.249552 type:complete len:205 (+) Transcript_96516:623-1237(+)